MGAVPGDAEDQLNRQANDVFKNQRGIITVMVHLPGPPNFTAGLGGFPRFYRSDSTCLGQRTNDVVLDRNTVPATNF